MGCRWASDIDFLIPHITLRSLDQGSSTADHGVSQLPPRCRIRNDIGHNFTALSGDFEDRGPGWPVQAWPQIGLPLDDRMGFRGPSKKGRQDRAAFDEPL